MKANTNMICDLETGVCGVPGENVEVVDFNKKIKNNHSILCDRPHLFSLLGNRTNAS